MRLTRQFDELRGLIDKANCERREDMATLAQLKLNAEKATQTLILDAGAELLLAIERLKQSQRSHKDTLLRAIDDTLLNISRMNPKRAFGVSSTLSAQA